jgi:hypothetical protein
MTKTQTHSGRQIETTEHIDLTTPSDLTIGDTTYKIVAISNNVRRYDGEVTQNNYWAVTDLGGYLSISAYEFYRYAESVVS